MIKLLQPKLCPIFGIDLTSTSVKILEISVLGDKFYVERYEREFLPAQVFDGHVVKDVDALAFCMKKISNRLLPFSKHVALAVPDAAVISKVIQIPESLNEREMEELITLEADQCIPYPIDEINLDFEILGYSKKNPTLLDIRILASRAENVNSRVEALTRAGFEVVLVDVESYAVVRAAQQLAKDLPESGVDQTVAIIDLGARYTHLFVLHGMQLIYCREEQFGGMQLIEAIAERYKMTLEKAEMAKDQGKLPRDYESELLEPFKEKSLLQIKRSLQFFYATNQKSFIDHILLAGGLARLSGLHSLIQEQLGVPVTVANPFSSMLPGKAVNWNAVQHDAPGLMVACGLALRNYVG